MQMALESKLSSLFVKQLVSLTSCYLVFLLTTEGILNMGEEIINIDSNTNINGVLNLIDFKCDVILKNARNLLLIWESNRFQK
jgi:hypothetical protein